MEAVCWIQPRAVAVQVVSEPRIEQSRDAIVRVTSSAIGGADLLAFRGALPEMRAGLILGREGVGEIVDIGSRSTDLSPGDRVLIPSVVACGECTYCERQLWAHCQNSNPALHRQAARYGHGGAGILGQSELFGGFPGTQAQYVRVPFADVGLMKIPENVTDLQALPLADSLPAGWMAAEYARIEPGSTVAVWGCGAVGQFAIQSAWRLGAGKVIAIDREPERLLIAEQRGKARALNVNHIHDLQEAILNMTAGKGPDCCIDAAGTDDPPSSESAATQAIKACRPGGTVVIVGSYYTESPISFASAYAKGLTLRSGQAHTHRYLGFLLRAIAEGELDPTFVFTHRYPLSRAQEAYELMQQKRDGCLKAQIFPDSETAARDRGGRRA